MKLNRHFFFITLFFCFFNLTLVFADNFKKSDIKIFGNKSISSQTILNYADKKKDILTNQDLGIFQKKLFETNFFSKVEIKIVGNAVEVYLVENPLIEYMFVTGLEKKEDFKKQIEKIISLKENNIFSESLLNADVKSIYEFLSSNGYFQSTVEYKVNQLTSGKVNVFLDVKLNQKLLVKNIFFIGDKKIPTSTLKSTISITEDSWFSIFNSSSVPSVDRINYDISLLKNFYLSKGYYDVQISNSSIDIIDKKHANITFVINAGNKYIFEKVLIDNKATTLKNTDILFVDSELKSIEKNYYNPSTISNVLKVVNEYFQRNNIAANIDYVLKKMSFDKMDIVFNIKEINEKRFINNITVKGNDLTEEKVIRNNIFFSEGDVFSSAILKKSIDSLKALQFFKKVNIETLDVDNSKNININISIEEMPTGEIAAGAGYGTTGGSISFTIKEKNLLGKGIESDVSMNLGTQQVIGKIALSDPDFTDNGNSLRGSFSVSKFNYDNAGYENKVIASSISTTYEALKDVYLESGFSADIDYIDAETGASSIILSRDGNYQTTKVFYNIYNDRRNRKFQPTSGHIFGFGQGLATFTSDIPYLSNTIFGSVYREFAEDYVGTIKYKIKSINSFGDKEIKLSDRIFLSDSELRGFANRSVGPKVSGEFIGGNYSYSTNFSTTVPNGLPEKWGTKANIFLDVANVWGADFSGALESNKIRSSVGLGFEWVSPAGPLSFTYAQPISKDSEDSVKNFSFQLGGTF